MAGCCGSSCVCRLTAGADALGHEPVVIVGTGTTADPFVISLLGVDVDDTTDLNLTLTFDPARGYVISGSFATTSKLDDIGDVDASAPTNAQVLSWNTGAGKWQAAAPTTASAGSVQRDTSLTGDGSIGTPLEVAHATGGGTQTTSGGIGLTNAIFQQLVRSFTNAAARTTADPTPDLNGLSMLDSAPGLVDVWDGTAWTPLLVIGNINAVQYLALSGVYDGRSTNLNVIQLSTTTAADGSFVAYSAAQLAGAAGVLSCIIQPVGTTAFVAVLDPTDVTQCKAIAYALDGSGPLGSQAISATVSALTY